jgi:hypothetical protein
MVETNRNDMEFGKRSTARCIDHRSDGLERTLRRRTTFHG